MHPLLGESGETNLIIDDKKNISVNSLEDWQVDVLMRPRENAKSFASSCLIKIDYIVTRWLNSLTIEQWNKINSQKSLFGISIPKEWVVVWRFIVKTPELRDPERATRNGNSIGNYSHLWNLWSKDCISKYTTQLEKQLISLVDQGYPYGEIGIHLLGTYGDEFWKPRKEDSKTTPSQVVNNYLYQKIPNKIARKELTEICLSELKTL